MPRFKLRFDEFFKRMAVAFFELFGFRVTTEVELFKLPKKADVIVISTENLNSEAIRRYFSVLNYFKEHNIISFKSLGDRVGQDHIIELLSYYAGYINMTTGASPDNTTISLIAGNLPPKSMEPYTRFCRNQSPGHWILELNLLEIHVLDLKELVLSGYDSYFLAAYAPPERLPYLAKIVQRTDPAGLEKNILDKLKESLYIRIKSFEPEDLWEGIMPTAMEADITDLVMPYLEKIREESELRGKLEGKLEGVAEGERRAKLETARRMHKRGLDLTIIAEDTGLTLEELKAEGIE
ncbi:MAG: hypothetical protein HS115_03055 [Spirochaetales bacterium]|nr:hypothetical protein [Spirochaetales bacterium]